jgi:two-component system response regulator RegA
LTEPLDILVVDDDDVFRERLLRAFVQRELRAAGASNYEAVATLLASRRVASAVVDLRMPGLSGLSVVRLLREANPETRAVVLTGFGSIATAVEAMRLGALDYLNKPCDADRILAALAPEPPLTDAELSFETPSLARVEREHIERVLHDCGGNVSRCARVLGIHRRTLQYKLAKFPVRR